MGVYSTSSNAGLQRRWWRSSTGGRCRPPKREGRSGEPRRAEFIGDAVLTLVGLTTLMADSKPKGAKPAAKVVHRMAPHPPSAEMRSSDGRLSAAQVFAALNEIRPTNAVLVE